MSYCSAVQSFSLKRQWHLVMSIVLASDARFHFCQELDILLRYEVLFCRSLVEVGFKRLDIVQCCDYLSYVCSTNTVYLIFEVGRG